MFINVDVPGHQLLLPDFPGFGTNAPEETDFTLMMVAEALKAALDAWLTNNEPIVLGGISMGGYLAFEFLRKYPDKVSKMILISTKTGADSLDAKATRLAMAEKVLEDGIEYLPGVLIPGLLGETTLINRQNIVKKVKDLILMANPPAVAGAQKAMACRRDQRGYLSQIKIPTLVIAGAEDKLILLTEAKDMAQRIPKSELMIIKDAGHLVPMESPYEFSKLLTCFLC